MPAIIPVFEVLSWLNEFDNTCLSRQAQLLVGRLRDPINSEGDIDEIINALQGIGQGSPNPLEIAEISLNCAAIDYWRMMFSQSARSARRAVALYRNNNEQHRLAVARWILGMSQWEQLENSAAYPNWSSARTIFRRQQRRFRGMQNNASRERYEEHLRLMECDLVSKPEEIIPWLNRYEGSSLSNVANQILRITLGHLRQRRFQEAFAKIDELLEIGQQNLTLYERAETLLEGGLIAYQTGNNARAIDLLKKAVVEFPAKLGGNHKQVITRWMLGAIEWMVSGKKNQAISDWGRCIDEIEKLRLRADRDNQQEKKKWYADQRSILQAALAEQISASNSSRMRSNRPGQQGMASGPAPVGSPETPPPGPVSGQAQSEQDRYEYLCSLVGGDRNVADRNIDYQRQKVPNASRAELIERAIERLLRDRK